ncbi:hypothetical protein SNEBB_002785 [Seison nebaliae]|nr:hypothetical protein SNEBB_002785 [Seison nebaliae]
MLDIRCGEVCPMHTVCTCIELYDKETFGNFKYDGDCQYKDFADVPNFDAIHEGLDNPDLAPVSTLDLMNNDIREVKPNAFTGLNVREILLARNPLTTIHEGAWDGLKDLKSLNLDNTLIEAKQFVNLPKLDDLEMLSIQFTSTVDCNCELVDFIKLVKERQKKGNFTIMMTCGQGGYNGEFEVFEDFMKLIEEKTCEEATSFVDEQLGVHRKQHANGTIYFKRFRKLLVDLNEDDEDKSGATSNFTFMMNVWLLGSLLVSLCLCIGPLTFPYYGTFTYDGRCSERDFKEIPNFIDNIKSISSDQHYTQFHLIDLSDNDITLVRNKAFNMLSVHEIILNNNPITTIEEGAFDGINGLEALSLDNTRLKNVELSKLPDLSTLNYLSLKYIRTIDCTCELKEFAIQLHKRHKMKKLFSFTGTCGNADIDNSLKMMYDFALMTIKSSCSIAQNYIDDALGQERMLLRNGSVTIVQKEKPKYSLHAKRLGEPDSSNIGKSSMINLFLSLTIIKFFLS